MQAQWLSPSPHWNSSVSRCLGLRRSVANQLDASTSTSQARRNACAGCCHAPTTEGAASAGTPSATGARFVSRPRSRQSSTAVTRQLSADTGCRGAAAAPIAAAHGRRSTNRSRLRRLLRSRQAAVGPAGHVEGYSRGGLPWPRLTASKLRRRRPPAAVTAAADGPSQRRRTPTRPLCATAGSAAALVTKVANKSVPPLYTCFMCRATRGESRRPRWLLRQRRCGLLRWGHRPCRCGCGGRGGGRERGRGRRGDSGGSGGKGSYRRRVVSFNSWWRQRRTCRRQRHRRGGSRGDKDTAEWGDARSGRCGEGCRAAAAVTAALEDAAAARQGLSGFVTSHPRPSPSQLHH